MTCRYEMSTEKLRKYIVQGKCISFQQIYVIILYFPQKKKKNLWGRFPFPGIFSFSMS